MSERSSVPPQTEVTERLRLQSEASIVAGRFAGMLVIVKDAFIAVRAANKSDLLAKGIRDSLRCSLTELGRMSYTLADELGKESGK